MSLRMPRDRLGEKLSNLKSLSLGTPVWSAEYLVDCVKTNLLSLRSFGLPRGMSKSMRTQMADLCFSSVTSFFNP